MTGPIDDDILDQSALALAEALRARKIGCEELTRAYLARIAARDGALSAFVTTMPRRAVRLARKLDRAGPGPDAPVFWGVPNAIKDIHPVAGTYMRAGSRAFRHVVAPIDGAAARRTRAGGFVLLGKTTTSELAILPITEPDIHPPTRNPWDLERSAGGSSGGAAAAVAAGMLPIAHASDGAGSIRIPAAFCHLYGFKPSRAAVPNFYPADTLGLSSTGCVAHTVRDAAAMLDVLAGRPRPARDAGSFLATVETPPPPLRVRLCVESPFATVDPAIREAVRNVARRLADLGHRVEEVPFPAIGTVEDFLPLMQRMVANVPLLSRRFVQPVTAWMHAEGRRVDKKAAHAGARKFAARILAWCEGTDLLLTPTVATYAPPVGSLDGMPGDAAFASIVPLGAFTAAFNVSGQAAASIPAGLGPDGLPIGAQLVGRPGEDALVLRLSRQLEEAMPWRERRAPIR